MLSKLRAVLAAAVLLAATPALSVPITYGLDTVGGGSNIQIQAFNSLTTELVFDQTLTLAVGSFVTWDSAGVPTGFGSGTLDDFSLVVTPNQGPYPLVNPFGPFNMVTIESASIAPDFGAGYATVVSVPLGGDVYSVTAGDILIDALYGASNSGGSPPPVSGVPADITGVTDLSGQISLLSGGVQLSLTGLNMGTVSGAPFGETADLELTANITFFGDDSAPVPEPGTASLLAFGLAGMASARRLRRS